MTRRLADQRGLVLTELLVTIVLVSIVLGATLTTFTEFERNEAVNQRQNEAQERVRVGLAGVARELRNLASPTDELPEAILRAGPADLVFQSVSSSVLRRVRYCLDAGSRRLWRQVQLQPFSLPSTACPDSAWGTERTAIQDVVNGARPLFGYNVEDPQGITEISTTVWVDVDPGVEPKEVSLQTSIFLRNQNRRPSASFTATVSGGSVLLNGSESFDPEGRTLEFFWYDRAATGAACDGLEEVAPQPGCVATGIVATYTPTAPGPRDLYLIVRDAAGLTDVADDQPVCIPGGAPC